jgi:hypothetical protein
VDYMPVASGRPRLRRQDLRPGRLEPRLCVDVLDDAGMGSGVLLATGRRPLPRLADGAADDAAETRPTVVAEVLEAVGVRHVARLPACQLALPDTACDAGLRDAM